jgi:hypothetical protein
LLQHAVAVLAADHQATGQHAREHQNALRLVGQFARTIDRREQPVQRALGPASIS